MSCVALLSSKGSPGVTSLTVALCLLWGEAAAGRSAIAVDADPAGGDIAAGVLAGAAPATSGMLALATSREQDALRAVSEAAIPLRPDGTARVIPGVPDSARAPALNLAWDHLDRALPELDVSSVDVLIDCGRVDTPTLLPPWVEGADLAVMVVRSTLPAVASGRRFVDAWRGGARTDFGSRPAGPPVPPPLRLVVVDIPGGYGATEVSKVLDVGLLAVIPHDPVGARAFSDGDRVRRGAHRSALHRQVRGLGARIAQELGSAATTAGSARVLRSGAAGPVGQVSA